MRAARYHEYGDAESLVVEEAPEPKPEPGEIRIRVSMAGVNPVDWKVRSGAVRDVLPVEFPAIPGRDAVGIVDQTGADVSGVRAGDRVFGLTGVTGATAELVTLSAWALAPDIWSDEEAAGAGLASVTALSGLEPFGPLEGRTLLIEGAAGGVGSAAVEIALAHGATVIGTAGEHNHDFLRELGASATTYGAGLAERVSALAPRGIDFALDAAASGSLSDLVSIAGSPSRVATVADHVNGPRLGTHVANARNDSALLAIAAELGAQGRYTPRIERSYPLDEIAQAHAHGERGHVRGKIVIRI